MKCEKVLGQLSLFLDEMIEGKPAAEISQHLALCGSCSCEFAKLRKVTDTLKSLEPAETPDYLYNLVELKVSGARQNTWRSNLRSALEYHWSRVRTTEGKWYFTRLAGLVATAVFFVAISSAMNPIYLGLANTLPVRGYAVQVQPPQQLAKGLQRVFGSPVEAQKRPIRASEPKINDLYLVNLSQTTLSTGYDDTVSVITVVDRSGTAKVQDILEYPADDSLLSDFTDMITTAGWRPASRNGRAIDSPLVLTFSKIYVYN